MNKQLLLLLILLAFTGTILVIYLGTTSDAKEPLVNDSPGSEEDGQTDEFVTQYAGIESLEVSCTLEGVACDVVSDSTAGTCRVVEWSTEHGPVRIQGCEKQGEVEVYRQEFPAGVAFSACLGSGCVDSSRGWVSFTPASSGTASDEPSDQPTSNDLDTSDDASEWGSPADSIDTAGLAAKYEVMLRAWQGQEVDRVTIDGEPLIVVPWFVDDKGAYHTGCGAEGTRSDYCVVTDEDSQYTLAVSMSRDEQLVNAQAEALFNKIRHVSTTYYGRNTRWQFRVTDGDVVLGTNDFASDADARYLLALFSFASNPVLDDEALKEEMLLYAQGYCADYKRHAFIVDEHAGVTYWPVGGGHVGRVGSLAESSNWRSVTYPGYYGDMSLAMLACGANTGDEEYFVVADDALKAYFMVAGYDGSSLQVAHGRSGTWSVDDSGALSYVCQDGCPGHGGTEDADGVRFTSMCTVDYYANQLDLEFTSLTNSFCEEVVSSEGFTRTAYATQWAGDGGLASGLSSGWQANGLPLYVDVGRTSWAADRFNAVWADEWTGASFNDAQFFDVFWGGFLVNGLGFNLGYADEVFLLSASSST